MSERLRAAVAATLLPGFDGLTLPAWLHDRLSAGLGGVCLFGENIRSPEQLRALTDSIRAANPHAIIAIDEEGGDVTRLFYDVGSPYPGNAVLGRLDDETRTAAVARSVGHALLTAGVNLDFAPDIDVNSNPDNPVIGVRSFGESPALAARHSAAWVRGLQSTGVAACAKHFPGHGDTATDSHRALPVVDVSPDVLRSRELVPFRAAISAGVRTVMTSHILLPQLDPEHPATLSGRVIAGLLRTELGFDGVIVSDALDMAGASAETGMAEAAVRALAAECDLLCIGTRNTDAQLADIEETVMRAVADGRLDEARLAAAAAAVRSLGAELERPPVGGPPHTSASSSLIDQTPAPSPTPGTSTTGPDASLPTPELVAGTFDVTADALDWLAQGAPTVLARLETAANAAIGSAPWGPFAALEHHGDDSVRWRPDSVITVTAETATDLERLCADPRYGRARLAVVGRAIHLTPWATRLIDALRRGCDVLVVDMGWPAPDRAYADIATFGASRLVGEALLGVLGGRASDHPAATAHARPTADAIAHPLSAATTRPHHERLAR